MIADEDFALLDEDAWDAPDHLTEDDCWAVTSSASPRDRHDEEDGR
jgi:hypothetical protein